MLESMLGETVSVRTAAKMLGVSHTALNRWIDSGDVATVLTSRGRKEVPVPFLLRLREAVSGERESGRRRGHVLEKVMRDAQVRADEIDVHIDRVLTDPHNVAAHRSLMFHRVIAERLTADALAEAMHTVWKWRSQHKLDPYYADEWEKVLDLPLADVRAVITEQSDRGRDLRQNSPFAGALSEPERRRIVELIR